MQAGMSPAGVTGSTEIFTFTSFRAVTATLRFATIPINTSAADIPASSHIEGRLASSIQVERQIPGDANGYGGFVTQAVSRLSIQNLDGLLDALPDIYQWRDRPIQLLAARTTRSVAGREMAPAMSEFSLQFDGKCVNLEVDRDALEITVEEGTKRLDRPAQNNLYIGSGGIDGGEDLVGVPRPMIYGFCRNVTPTMVDQLLLIAQVHDGGINGIPAVYDRGVKLIEKRDCATYGELEALVADVGDPDASFDIGPGEYATCLAAGCFRLGGSPVGTVTADVRGDGQASGPVFWTGGKTWKGGKLWAGRSGTAYARYVGEIFRRIMLNRANYTEAEIDQIRLTQFDQENPFEVGVYVSSADRITVRELITQLLSSIGAIAIRTRFGHTSLMVLEPPAPDPVLTIDSYMIAQDGIDRIALPHGAPWPIIRQRHSINWTVQTAEQLSIEVTGAARDFAMRKASYSEYQDAILGAVLPDRPPLIIDGVLINSADARTIATRLVAFYDRRFNLYRVIARGIGFRLDLLDTIKVRHSRFGLDMGKNLLVMSIIERPGRYETELFAYG
jgi:hypothetical protein